MAHRECPDPIEFAHARTVARRGCVYGSGGMLLDDPLDPRVREYAHPPRRHARLRAEGPEGARDGVFIAEGELVIERAARLGYRMRSLLLLEQRLERFGRLAPEGVPVYEATGELMRSITGFPTVTAVCWPRSTAGRCRGRARARRAARRRARGRQQPHQRRRHHPQRLGARRRRPAARPGQLRPALPPLAAHLDGRGAEPPRTRLARHCRGASRRCALPASRSWH